MTDKDAKNITVDGVKYSLSELTENAKTQVAHIQFVESQLQQLRNEWAVADTARLAYTQALKNELAKNNDVS